MDQLIETDSNRKIPFLFFLFIKSNRKCRRFRSSPEKINKYPAVKLGTNLFSGKSFQVTIKKWRLKNKNQVYPTSDSQIYSLYPPTSYSEKPLFHIRPFNFNMVRIPIIKMLSVSWRKKATLLLLFSHRTKRPLSIRIDRKDANFDTKKKGSKREKVTHPFLKKKTTSRLDGKGIFVPKRVDTT